MRIYFGAPYGLVVCNITAHLFPVDNDRRRVTVAGGDSNRFRLTDGGELLVVDEQPALTGQIGDEYVFNITSSIGGQFETVVALRVFVSQENTSPPRFIPTSTLTAKENDGSYSADAYRFDAGGTALRMRQTFSVSDDDVDDYNRVATFSLIHHGTRSQDRHANYISIDPVTGQLSSGRVLRAAPRGEMQMSILAANSDASPPLNSSVDITVYICDVPGDTSTREMLNNVKC